MSLPRSIALACTIVAPLGCTPQTAAPVPNANARPSMSSHAVAGAATRVATPVAAKVTAAVAPTCRAPKVTEGRELLPASLDVVGGIDLKGMVSSPLWAEVDKLLKTDPDASKSMSALDRCGLGLASWHDVAMGANTGGGDDVVMVVEAKGLGSVKTLECVARELGTPLPKLSARKVDGCVDAFDVDDGGSIIFVDADTLAFVSSAPLERAVVDRMKGKGKGALDSGLKWARSGLDLGKTMWFAVAVSKTMRSEIGKFGPGLQRLGGTIDASKGLGLDIGLGYDTTTRAKEMKGTIETEIAPLKMMGPMLGVPSKVLNSIDIDRSGETVSMEMFASLKDLEEIRRSIDGMTGAPHGGATPESAEPPKGI